MRVFMTDKNGYCLAYRRAWTHDAFNDLLEAAIWNFLYQNAFYEDGERTFNSVVYYLKRGQIVTTPRFLAEGFRISESNARRVIQKLIKLKSIETQTTTKATIITICNYDKYQLPQKTDEDQTDDQTKNKQKTNDANNNKRINKGTNKERKLYIDQFEEFWEEYPRKLDKKKAKSKFIGLSKKGVDYEEVIAGATKYKQYCQANNTLREYIKHPTTWLNGECWKNEYTFAKKKEKPKKECGMSQIEEYLGWN